MAKVRVRPETGNLYLDIFYRGQRCREQTSLPDTPTNRRNVEALANRIARAIATGSFEYKSFFPDSPRAAQFAAPQTASPRSEGRADSSTSLPASTGPVPTFGEFAQVWFDENKPRWRDTHAETIRGTLDQHILPAFRARQLGEITRADLLAFRGELGKLAKKNGDTLSPSRINHIMTPPWSSGLIRPGAD